MSTALEHSILLVEDDENDVWLIERAFRTARLANPLQVVRDGEAAVEFLRAGHPVPELVLLDLKLPRKSGHEVLAWVRSQPGLRRLPVVVLTSSRERLDVNRAYDGGANSYLVKPVAFESLQDLVRTLNVYWIALNEKPDVAHA